MDAAGSFKAIVCPPDNMADRSLPKLQYKWAGYSR